MGKWNVKYYFKDGQTKQYVNGKPDKIWVNPNTGQRLNLSEMDRKWDKKECMKVAKLLPADDRLEYLRGCGALD